jgi:hypothetical protein
VYLDSLANGQTIGVEEEDAAELELPRVLVTGDTVTPPLLTADEMALTSELTAPEGRVADGLARTEDRSEAREDPIETAGFVKDAMAEDKAGAPVTAGSLAKDETKEEKAGFPFPPPIPTPAPIPAPADTPGRLAMTDEAALVKEEAALAGIVAEGLAAIELNKLEMAGATDAAGFAVERKPRAEEAAAAALGTEPASEATEPRMEESWEGAPAAASTSEEAAPVGMAAVLPAMELNRLEILGATDAAGFAVERKFNADEAAAAASCAALLAASGAEVAADATEPRSDDSSAAAEAAGVFAPTPAPAPSPPEPEPREPEPDPDAPAPRAEVAAGLKHSATADASVDKASTAISMRSPSKLMLPLFLISAITSSRLEPPMLSMRACLFVGMAEELARSSVIAEKPAKRILLVELRER